MKLSEKMELLRELEGSLRGLNRPLTKSEVARLVESEQGETISVAFLSQLESGKRPHMTETTRDLLARFYKVHPGYFVSDPEGYNETLTSMPPDESRFDSWLLSGARQFATESPDLAAALKNLANHEASCALVLLMGEMVGDPNMLARLRDAFTGNGKSSIPKSGRKEKK